MLPQNPVETIDTYAVDPSYIEKPGETSGSYDEGVVPLDTLPAAWWNWLWNQITLNEGRTVTALNNLFAEITAVLTEAGITPTGTDTTQLKQAIYALSQRIATTSVAGAVKSSTVNGKVTVENDGTMTANGLGNVSNLTTTAKLTVVAAINEIHTAVGANANAIADIVNKIGDLTTVTGNPASVAAGLQALHGSISSFSSSVASSISSIASSISSLSSSIGSLNSSMSSVTSSLSDMSISSNWNDAYDKVTANSAAWNGAYDAITNSSSIWNAADDSWKNSSSAWNANSGWKNSSSAWNANSGWKNSSLNWNRYISGIAASKAISDSSAAWNANSGWKNSSAAWNANSGWKNSSVNWNKYVSGTVASKAISDSSASWNSAYDFFTSTLKIAAGKYEGGADFASATVDLALSDFLLKGRSSTGAGDTNIKYWALSGAPMVYAFFTANGTITTGALHDMRSSALFALSSVNGSSANWGKGYSSGTAAYKAISDSSASWNNGYSGYTKVTGSSANWNKASTNGSWTGSSANWNGGYSSGSSAYTKVTASAITIPQGNAYSTRANIWIE